MLHSSRSLATWRCRFIVASLVLPCLAIAQVPSKIESAVALGAIREMHRPDFRDYQASVREFYAAQGYAPAWVQAGAVSAQGQALIRAFQDADKKGLNPEDYDASLWDGRREALQQGGDPAMLDVALTVNAMRYISDLHIGRINPRHVNFELSVEEKKYDLADFLRNQVLPARDVSAVLAEAEPPFPAYRRTEAALARYLELAQQGDGEKLPVPEKAIDPGQPYAGLPQLTKFLQRVGDLPPETNTGGAAPQLYDGALVEAVKRFQRRHGLDDDGRLGRATVTQMNVPFADRVRQLQLTLERWRWLPGTFPAPPIIVNIPDFHLRTLTGDNTVDMDMRVMVGKAMHTETPVFSRDMTYVVFRPYWVVPPGIMRRSILPAIRRNRDYIASNRYEVTTPGGKVVTSGTITDDVLAQLESGRLMVRQKPGPKNALGLVKLIFPNEHSVYLHSTPSTELFGRTRRDFSSGCIRVEKPAELTTWVLRNNPDWSLERVQQAMESGPDNVTVKLARPVPVFIVYGTAIGYPDGEVRFYDDIYGHDARLSQALARR
jgi:murein L,D-transpeptidase YcbB/YkuD